MPEKVSILLIESKPDDAMRITAELDKSSDKLVVRQVENLQQAESQLDDTFPDLIVSEFSLPEGTALDMLELLADKQLSIPLIVVSDMLDPITATDVMKAGAADYVIKDKLFRLPYAINKILANRKNEKETTQPSAIKTIQHLESRISSRTAELEECTRRLNDETEKRKEAQQTINLLKQQLKKVEKQKSDFMSVVSHDLRAPLTSIVGFAETMLMPDMNLTTEEKSRFLEIIKDEGKRLGEFIGSFMEVSKIESGELSLQLSQTPLLKTIHEVIESLSVPDNTDILISEEYRQEIILHADEQRLRKVFENVLNNVLDSITSQGVIVVYLEENYSTIDVAIQAARSRPDSSEKARLFHKLHHGRVEPWKQERRGTELKMTIANGLIKAHGGEMWYDPHGENGKTFYLQLPMNVANNVRSVR